MYLTCIQGDPKRFVPMKISIVTLIKKLFISNYNHTLFSLWKTGHSPEFQLSVFLSIFSQFSPESKKWASSENQTFSRKFSSFSSILQNHSHIVTRFSLSASVSFCFIWILYGYRWFWWKVATMETFSKLNLYTRVRFCRKIGLQGEYLLLICPRHFWGNYSCKVHVSSIGSPFTSCNRKDIR